MAWATITQVEDWLGLPSDTRMVHALAAAEAWAQRTRPDLDPAGPVHADVQHAVIILTGLMYRERTSPQGFSTYEAIDTAAFTDQSAMINVYRLIGSRKPVAR
jgi:hypothetical protein